MYFIVWDLEVLDSDKKFTGGVCQRKAQFLQSMFWSGKSTNKVVCEWSGPAPLPKVKIGKR